MTAARLDAKRPRVGFLGVGWIGRARLDAIARQDVVDVVGVADCSEDALARARELAPAATFCRSLDELLDRDLDGVVIATPSAQHADQARRVLERGAAVFCQKPLARSVGDVASVVDAARQADRLLQLDMSYRHLDASGSIREAIRAGSIGDVYAADLVFHNAYGPDKPWCFDRRLSGGGCLIDLGVHLVDLGLWALDFPDAVAVTSRLYARGHLWDANGPVEDHVLARVDLVTGASLRLTCSWNLPIGRDADISATFYGTAGSLEMGNVDGSFYRFRLQKHTGRQTEVLADGSDAAHWSGRAAAAWAHGLAAGNRFDNGAVQFVQVAHILDRIYEHRPEDVRQPGAGVCGS
jgi:predicted dehydrogenase